MDDNHFELDRFIVAQAPIYDDVIAELSQGHKTGHWMWYIFPQHMALGKSVLSKRYGIANLSEAQAYAAHPILGARLRECTELVMTSGAKSLISIFGPDDIKFRSSMTLFALTCADNNSCFHAAINRWCAGFMDQKTVDLVCGQKPIARQYNEGVAASH